MGAELSWYLEGRIIRLSFIGNVTEEDLAVVNQNVSTYLDDAGTAVIHLVVDDTRMDKTPPIFSVPKNISFTKNPRLGWIIVFGMRDDALIRMFSAISAQVLKTRYRFVNSMNEALKTLNRVDPTLPDFGIE